MIKIFVSGRKAQVSMLESEKLTTRSIRAKAYVDFGPDWNDLVITSNVQGSGSSIDILIDESGEIVIPHECLTTAGGRCKIGFQGVELDENGIAVRQVTAYADLGIILKGTEPSGETEQPATLRIWEQIEANLANETTERETEDAALSERISEEVMLREASDTALATLIASVNETIDTVSGKIDAEETRATAAEQNLNRIVGDLETEVQALDDVSTGHGERLVNAESFLEYLDGKTDTISALVERETSRATAAEQGIHSSKQDKLVAGDNITIDGNVISASGGGPAYDDTELRQMIAGKADTNHNHDGVYQPIGDYASQDDLAAKQDKLTAGNNITIVGNVISSTGGGGGSYDDTELRQLIAGKSDVGHNHDGTYQPAGSYASADHNHTGVYQPVGSYAAANHNHTGVYQPVGNYAAADHDHDGTYQPAGSYAAANHNHSGVYQPAGNYALASEIPTDTHINSLIDAALGVIENGSY